MYEAELKPLAKACAGILEVTDGLVSWEWDSGFGAALTVATADQAETVLKALEPQLPLRFTVDGLDDAPELIQELADGLGGLRSGQILLASSLEESAILFGAWWPWNDGQRISLRIAGVAHLLEDLDQNELGTMIRGWLSL